MKSLEVPSREILMKLLQDSAQKKLGAWELQKWSDGYRVILAVKIPIDSKTSQDPAAAKTSEANNAAELQAAIRLVLYGADGMEEELTGKDEF